MDSDKQRILIFAPSYHAEPQGPYERSIREITNRIVLPNLEFHMITTRNTRYEPALEWVGNVQVHRVGPPKSPHTTPGYGPLGIVRALWQARTLHAQNHYCGVWSVTACDCAIATALFARMHSSVQYIQSLHEHDTPTDIMRRLRPYAFLGKRVFTQPNRMHAMSPGLAEWARTQGATCPIAVVHDGIDLTEYEQQVSDADRALVRTALGAQEGDVWLISTLPLTHASGLGDAITALSVLPPHIKLALLGRGADEHVLRTQAAGLGLTKRVVFTGSVPPHHLSAYLHVCDIFLAPINEGRAARACARAFAATLPVVGTHKGDLSDLLYDVASSADTLATGWVCEPDKPRELARTILDVLGAGEEVVPVLEHARNLAHERYTWNTNARELFITTFAPMLEL